MHAVRYLLSLHLLPVTSPSFFSLLNLFLHFTVYPFFLYLFKHPVPVISPSFISLLNLLLLFTMQLSFLSYTYPTFLILFSRPYSHPFFYPTPTPALNLLPPFQVSADLHQFEIRDLHPGKKYEVQVLAGTKAGYPTKNNNWSWTPLRMPTLTPRNVPLPPVVTLRVLNDTSEPDANRLAIKVCLCVCPFVE